MIGTMARLSMSVSRSALLWPMLMARVVTSLRPQVLQEVMNGWASERVDSIRALLVVPSFECSVVRRGDQSPEVNLVSRPHSRMIKFSGVVAIALNVSIDVIERTATNSILNLYQHHCCLLF